MGGEHNIPREKHGIFEHLIDEFWFLAKFEEFGSLEEIQTKAIFAVRFKVIFRFIFTFIILRFSVARLLKSPVKLVPEGLNRQTIAFLNIKFEAKTASKSEDESEYDFESDSEDGFGLDLLQESKFLKLGEEPELIDQMFEDLSNPNFMQQTLLLLAWNCQDAQNFQAVTGDNQAQQLFDTIIACMFATAADFCLPIARCASLLVSQLVESHDIKITQEQFDVLVKTLVQWSISNQAETGSKLTS